MKLDELVNKEDAEQRKDNPLYTKNLKEQYQEKEYRAQE